MSKRMTKSATTLRGQGMRAMTSKTSTAPLSSNENIGKSTTVKVVTTKKPTFNNENVGKVITGTGKKPVFNNVNKGKYR